MAELGKPAALQLSELGAYLGPGAKANGRHYPRSFLQPGDLKASLSH